jgi:hypothetical protein
MNLIPFVSEQPEPSLRRSVLGWLMRLVNRNPHRLWYVWKSRLLLFYGAEDGFDTQRYEAPCWTCGGSGADDYGSCDDCYEGVHHVTRTMLRRHVVEGMLFHQVVETGRIWDDAALEELEALEAWHRRLTGRVRHRATSERVSREAEAWMLLVLGQYRGLWQWLNGAGVQWQEHVGLPMVTLRFVLTRPKLWRRRLSQWWLRHAWMWRDGLLNGVRMLCRREWNEVPF